MNIESGGESLVTQVLGVTDVTDPVATARQAFATLSCSPGQSLYMSKSPPSPERLAREVVELGDDAASIRAILTADAYAMPANTLTSWPTYRNMLDRYGQRAGSDNPRALLLGAISPLSTRSFVCFAETEYGVSEERAYVVDLATGVSKARHGRFMLGDALHLPVQSDSMDFVHTNYLLYMLKDPLSSRPLKQRIHMLLGEIVRVLAPGGQLLMAEKTPGIEDERGLTEKADKSQKLATFMKGILTRAGLEYVHADLDRVTESYDYLTDPNRNFAVSDTVENAGGVQVYARKAAKLPAIQLH